MKYVNILLLLGASMTGLHAAAGALDVRFGNDGVVITDFVGGEDVSYALATDPRGRLLAAGVSQGPEGNALAVARYWPDGSLDATFGTGGKVRVDVTPDDDQAATVGVSPSGRIAIAGISRFPTGQWDAVVAVLTSDGRLDPTFGSNGIVTSDFGTHYSSIGHLQFLPDGRVVVAGSRIANVNTAAERSEFVLARYLTNGSLDPSFGVGGLVIPDLPLSQIAVAPGSEVVAVGNPRDATGSRILLARFTRDGQLDPAFGDAGTVTTPGPTDAYLYSVALTRSGDILVGGVTLRRDASFNDPSVVRFTRRGELDPSFGMGGIATLPVAGDRSMTVTAIAPSHDGGVVAAGFTYGNYPVKPSFAVAVFDRHGQPDSTFGSGGIAVTGIGSRAEARGLALLAGGDIVLSGFSDAPNRRQRDFALVRYDRR
jgi:uncharacterized delta-60 repeat protein